MKLMISGGLFRGNRQVAILPVFVVNYHQNSPGADLSIASEWRRRHILIVAALEPGSMDEERETEFDTTPRRVGRRCWR
jgi:hypothetical protein